MNYSLLDPQRTGFPHHIMATAPLKNIQTITCNKRGTHLAAGSTTGLLWILSMDTFSVLFQLVGHKATITSISFSSDHHYLVSGSEDGIIIFWDLTTQVAIYQLQLKFPIRQVLMYPQIKNNKSQQQQVLALIKDTEPITFQLPTNKINSDLIKFTPILANEASIKDLDLESQRWCDQLFDFTAATFDNKGELLLLGTAKGLLAVVDPVDGNRFLHIERNSRTPITMIRFHPFNSEVMLNCKSHLKLLELRIDNDNRISFNYPIKFTTPTSPTNNNNSPEWTNCNFDHTGELILATFNNDTSHKIHIFDRSTNEQTFGTLIGPGSKVLSLLYLPNQPTIVSVDKSMRSLWLWAPTYQQRWSGFEPKFLELQSNLVVNEREDAYDLPYASKSHKLYSQVAPNKLGNVDHYFNFDDDSISNGNVEVVADDVELIVVDDDLDNDDVIIPLVPQIRKKDLENSELPLPVVVELDPVEPVMMVDFDNGKSSNLLAPVTLDDKLLVDGEFGYQSSPPPLNNNNNNHHHVDFSPSPPPPPFSNMHHHHQHHHPMVNNNSPYLNDPMMLPYDDGIEIGYNDDDYSRWDDRHPLDNSNNDRPIMNNYSPNPNNNNNNSNNNRRRSISWSPPHNNNHHHQQQQQPRNPRFNSPSPPPPHDNFNHPLRHHHPNDPHHPLRHHHHHNEPPHHPLRHPPPPHPHPHHHHPLRHHQQQQHDYDLHYEEDYYHNDGYYDHHDPRYGDNNNRMRYEDYDDRFDYPRSPLLHGPIPMGYNDRGYNNGNNRFGMTQQGGGGRRFSPPPPPLEPHVIGGGGFRRGGVGGGHRGGGGGGYGRERGNSPLGGGQLHLQQRLAGGNRDRDWRPPVGFSSGRGGRREFFDDQRDRGRDRGRERERGREGERDFEEGEITD